MDKTTARRHYRQARRTLDAQTRARHDQAIREHLSRHPLVQSAQTIAAYSAFDGEPDLAPWLISLAAAGTRIALPVISTEQRGLMRFRHWQAGNALGPNTLGIDEPGSGEWFAPGSIDIILVPLVAWTRSGQRLGMGAGYYDRFLAARDDSRRPATVGVAYECQRAETLQVDDWDIPMDHVVCEAGWFTCQP
ncbi:5-formyltetrahydrofolate cyclo-ligase [Marinihelvus fidelis]|uniref:5-formyltetrahydrofolate cyclo-ligase n=1 Tax=Marinihelvus fidelis TaxID=2613842 RepID=A0A5N0T7V4_9GAMM|nr:5-formyltetrahydrofolate cyclo-ligase [Marinihelvus fidelis]KAA9130808.1 5-formyltetrahydrofolate cyclo-ligase [Marinihelvus fidelis]